MNRTDELIEYPTITRLSNHDRNTYRMMHINVMDLLKRIEILEQQIGEYKKSKSALEQEISANKNEINSLKLKCSDHEQQLENKTKSDMLLYQEIYQLKTTCSSLEKRIQIYEMNKQSKNVNVQQTPPLPKVQKQSVKVGEVVKLGRYEGKEIEWQVLDVNQKDNSALLISKYLLFKKPYNDKRKACTWETCTLRKYLNNEFYTDAFNETEKGEIKEVIVKNPDNKEYGIKGGNDTKDKIFLLSIDEVNSYFKSDVERATTLTNGKREWYWLRSPGGHTCNAACVHSDGSVIENGLHVDDGNMGVRLALWANL